MAKTATVNPFEIEGKWYKANLHTHTTVSDGPLSPQERIDQYHEAGYHVLALTDHWKTHDVSRYNDRGMLVISGIEFHPPCADPPGGWWHFVGLDVPHGLQLFEDVDAGICIDKVRRRGGECFLAHPAWCGQDYHSFAHLGKVIAIEVFNATCDRHGRASSENEWSVALDHGWTLPAVAVDDCHCARTEDVCEGWTWLKMPRNSPGEVIRAIRTGACYASCGPTVHDFRIADGVIALSCSPAAQINFVGMPVQGARRRAGPGKAIRSFRVDTGSLRGWPWPYVRAVVTDAHGRKAWTNPLYPQE